MAVAEKTELRRLLRIALGREPMPGGDRGPLAPAAPEQVASPAPAASAPVPAAPPADPDDDLGSWPTRLPAREPSPPASAQRPPSALASVFACLKRE